MCIRDSSHTVEVPEIDGITIEVPQPNQIVVSGCDKQKVGQFAAEIREKRPPEPYKGKGCLLYTSADMLTRIRNANSARHDTVDVPASNMKKSIAQILLDEGYIKSYQIVDDGTQGTIHITLKYNGKDKVITGLRRVSKPGLRVYVCLLYTS